jgi:hypothetical protein
MPTPGEHKTVEARILECVSGSSVVPLCPARKPSCGAGLIRNYRLPTAPRTVRTSSTTCSTPSYGKGKNLLRHPASAAVRAPRSPVPSALSAPLAMHQTMWPQSSWSPPDSARVTPGIHRKSRRHARSLQAIAISEHQEMVKCLAASVRSPDSTDVTGNRQDQSHHSRRSSSRSNSSVDLPRSPGAVSEHWLYAAPC